ncbi:MAG: 23S rRNA (pseudouridine(1915)-N(3))-methyltransferase RlmH [Lachnospiraceae bacterium]|nr:23S rRNA (pseudouridine(1915)-N(3))-methyltransferase RlmH [Lachnospiraceae bacterium]
MTITVLCVGKIKERYLKDAVAEYLKRLSRYAKIEIAEVRDERTKEEPTERERAQVLDIEGERLLARIGERDYVIALAIDGKEMDSEGLAAFVGGRMNQGDSRLCFVIGGSYGLSEQVLRRADAAFSFSKMTFPHQLMRVILLEQVYRSFRILNHEPYHK